MKVPHKKISILALIDLLLHGVHIGGSLADLVDPSILEAAVNIQWIIEVALILLILIDIVRHLHILSYALMRLARAILRFQRRTIAVVEFMDSGIKSAIRTRLQRIIEWLGE